MFATRRSLVACSLALLGFALLAISNSQLRAADDAKKDDAKKFEPKAQEVLQSLTDFYKNAKSFRADIVTTVNIKGSPLPAEASSATLSLAVERPNKLLLKNKMESLQFVITSDGKQLTTYLSNQQKYSVQDAPADLDALVAMPGTQAMVGQSIGLMLVYPLLSSHPYELLTDQISEAKYVGEEDINGAKAHHLRLIGDPFSWDLWIDSGKQPLIQKIIPDLSKIMAAQQGQMPAGMKIEMVALFKNWSVDAGVKPEDFAFKAPAGAEKVDSIFGSSGNEGPHPLQDKPAPAFDLKLVSGGSAKLADHKGKDIVILDFWATWCGPCVQALPTITEVANKYKGKGVAFYAVNLAEDLDTVKAFLKEKNLTAPVALDFDGKVGESYQAEAIPQTVIVDKDGTVAVVHVGLLPNLKERLTQEIDDLLAGKKPGKKENKPAEK
jgi:peroxiredoxin